MQKLCYFICMLFSRWPFSYGIGLLASASAFTGITLNNHYRQKFKLFNHAKIASFMPAAVLPAMTAAMTHYILVTNDVLAKKFDCPVCAEIRSASVQVLYLLKRFCNITLFRSHLISMRFSQTKKKDFYFNFLIMRKETMLWLEH